MRGSAAFRTGVAPGGALAGPWVKNSLWTAARAVPSLDLRFADNKSLVDATTGAQLVTFTRASSGTFVGSDGLIQTAVTNLLLRSEEFDNAVWLKTGSSVDANVEVAPNGTLSADKLVEDTATSAHQLSANLAFNYVSGTTYTLSCYVKPAGRSRLQIAWRSDWFPSDSGVLADLTTGSVSSGANAVGSITAVGNGWYRISNTATADATGSSPSDLFLSLVDGANSSNYTGDGTSGIYIWGAQLEQSTTLGEYIPTTSTINSTPRFDHNPTTGESLGLLVEEQRTNLSQQSEDFSNAYWVKTDCTITANESTAPDGTLTADLWSNTGTPGIVTSSNITKDATARTYTGSLWVKGGSTAFTFSLDNGATANRGRAIFNLTSGTLTSVLNDGNFTNTSGTITAYPDDWYRLTITTTTSTITTIRLRPFFSGSNLTVRIWGAQVEEGAFATSYIPTTTAAVTRSADVASISGSNFSSWYRQDEGTVFADNTSFAANNARIASFSDNTSSNRATLNRGSGSGGNINTTVTVGGVAQVSALVLASSLVANTALKVAAGYKTSDFAGSVNGAAPVTQATGSMPTAISQLGIGNGEALGTNTFSGTIKRLAFWPTRLSNATLQAVTQ